MGRFESIDNGYARREAQALINNYNRKIAAWQRESETIKNKHAINLSDYLGFTDTELAGYTTPDELRFAIYNRLQEIDRRVEAMKTRQNIRETSARYREDKRNIRKSGKSGRRRGRPKSGLLSYGQYVYFAVCYNHGLGAFFMGYGAAEEGSEWEPTHLRDWGK